MQRKPNRLRVGVIGLGVIGSRAAANLRAAGHQVYVWNRTPRAEPNFLGSAVEVADLCDTLQLFVSDDAALLETVRAVAPALKARHLVLAHPTVSPAAAWEAAGIVEKTGARYLDAPFTGSRAAAGNGQLVYYVSGPEPARRDALPVLEATSKNVVVIGDEIGQAMVTKIATNLLTAAIVQSLAEALALARAAGIEPARFAEAMEHNGSRSGTSDLKLTAMIKDDHATPHFALKHMLRDARLALALAAEHRLTLPATATVAAQLYGADRRGWGDLDFAALARNFNPAPPTPAVAPTVMADLPPPAAPVALPATLETPAALPTPVAPAPSPPATTLLGLPAVPGDVESFLEEVRTPLGGASIPRGGLPFPPGEKPALPGETALPPKEKPSSVEGNAAPHREPAASPQETGKPPVEKPPQPKSKPAPVDVEKPTPEKPPAPATLLTAPVAPAPAPEPEIAAEPEPPRPPATRRTLLSWFQKGK